MIAQKNLEDAQLNEETLRKDNEQKRKLTIHDEELRNLCKLDEEIVNEMLEIQNKIDSFNHLNAGSDKNSYEILASKDTQHVYLSLLSVGIVLAVLFLTLKV